MAALYPSDQWIKDLQRICNEDQDFREACGSFAGKFVFQIEAEAGKLDKPAYLFSARNAKTVTLHDPCRLVRMGGIVEEQRFILRQAVKDFIEMTPNREQNYCCGGGGGQLSMTDYTARRRSAGRTKSEQIRRTQARVVATPCHNCLDQLAELNKHHKLGVVVKSVLELAAEAVVLGPPRTGGG